MFAPVRPRDPIPVVRAAFLGAGTARRVYRAIRSAGSRCRLWQRFYLARRGVESAGRQTKPWLSWPGFL